MCKEKGISLSMIRPLLFSIQNHFLKEAEEDDLFSLNLKDALKQEMESRFLKDEFENEENADIPSTIMAQILGNYIIV